MAYVDSLVGYTVGAVTEPEPDLEVVPSLVGFVAGRVRSPHHPVRVLVGDVLAGVPIRTWDGVQLR